MNLKSLFLAGDVPFSALLILSGACFYIGTQYGHDVPKFAIGERGAVVLDAVLDRPGASKEELQKEVTDPILDVLKHYADQGYVVIDSSKDDAGNYSVAALPRETVDITEALRTAVKKKAEAAKP
jgi:multidrug efflux pump subunit AcrB